MQSLLFVFLGGGLGSVVRYTIGRWINSAHTYNFPFGTLAANVLACVTLGLLIGLADHRQLLSPNARLFWAVGFCGGFSTFSTFSQETLTLFQNGLNTSAISYITISLFFCVGATYLGILAGEQI
ncbi:MAG: fluoride efflux transporter CrcB [Cyclobacteriaceae bacterium]|nr:fluoride efflux transporter CrcB [Cyclobacteriaceae bacterium]